MKISLLIDVLAGWAVDLPLIKCVYLYGSRVRGDVRADSDIDIAIELDLQPLSDGDADPVAAWNQVIGTWQDELESLIPLRVDVQLYLGDSSPLLKAALQRSHVLAYEKAGPSQLPWLQAFRKRSPRERVLVGH